MNGALLVDFGSTWTKVRAVDLDEARVVASAQAPSTVHSDVNTGLDAALGSLDAKLRGVRYRYRLGSSSAAGGLRMVTIGLVKELTAEAARQAALGAGAKVVGAFANRLTAGDVAAIEALAPDVILLTGGTDGGNRDVALHNAQRIARSRVAAPVVVACNREATDECLATLAEANKTASATPNVMPELNVLSIEPAREAIREVFMARIVHSKGIDGAGARLDAVLMPTPAAVLEGARLLSDGVDGRGLGPLVVVDPGGATTDVHSIASGAPSRPGVVAVGLPEPHAKRTVEGDLGMRVNAAAIVEAAGIEAIARDAGLPAPRVQSLVAALRDDTARLPGSADEGALDRALGRAAIRIAMRRHAGTRETVYTAHGPAEVQRGKDLSAVTRIVGTGGVIAMSADPRSLLEPMLASADEPQSLRPLDAALEVDRDYALYACGLLARVEPGIAWRVAAASLSDVTMERHGQSAHAS